MELIPAAERLYTLLPYVHRSRDADQGEALRQLLQVIGEQVTVIEEDIAQLYDNWFIETAESWVVPYLGALIGYTPVTEAGPRAESIDARGVARNAVLSPRQEVAHTLQYRRRKGTLAVLELLSNDVAGWPARAVEFYRLLTWAPYVGRTYPPGLATTMLAGHALADVRRVVSETFDSPFELRGHSVDVRRINSRRSRGRFNIPSVGVFAWRLRPYRVTDTEAKRLEEIGSHCFSFSAIGHDTQLFTSPTREASPSTIAGPLNVPAPIERGSFEHRLGTHPSIGRASEDYYGEGRSLVIRTTPRSARIPGGIVAADRVVPADLSDWTRYAPKPGTVAVDPELGRMMFPPTESPRHVYVTYHYGFSADMGGGEYDRPPILHSDRAISRFSERDVKQTSALLDDLHAAPGELMLYLQSRWSPEHLALLDARPAGEEPSEQLRAALLAELNALLDDASLFSRTRFPIGSGRGLISEALSSLAEQAVPARVVRVNRRLLEEALADNIAPSYGRFVVKGDETEAPSPLWPSELVASIDEAVARWREDSPTNGFIELARSGVYSLDGTAPEDSDAFIELGPEQSLRISAGNRTRPVVSIDTTDLLSVAMNSRSELVIDGLLIADGELQVRGAGGEEEADHDHDCDDRPRLVIRHTTLVPGWALNCECEPKRPGNPSLELMDFGGVVTLTHSIVGPIRIETSEGVVEPIVVRASDSIIDATRIDREAIGTFGPARAQAVLTLRRVTVIGEISTHAIELGEDSIFLGVIEVARRQIGCLRFCSLALPSRTPRRYHCQPDLAETAAIAAVDDPTITDPAIRAALIDSARDSARSRVRPVLLSTRYGSHRYCQLATNCPIEIAGGSDDESEMGAFHDLYQPQRAANLTARLAEFTPAGMDVAVLFAT